MAAALLAAVLYPLTFVPPGTLNSIASLCGVHIAHLASLLGCNQHIAAGDSWHNWVGTIIAEPGVVHYPTSEEQIVEIVVQAGPAARRLGRR